MQLIEHKMLKEVFTFSSNLNLQATLGGHPKPNIFSLYFYDDLIVSISVHKNNSKNIIY